MAGPACGKKNGARSTKHASWYQSLIPKVAKRKDKNVRKSSHGKFKNVADLVSHQERVSPRKKGFTLIELIITIVLVVGVIVAAACVAFFFLKFLIMK